MAWRKLFLAMLALETSSALTKDAFGRNYDRLATIKHHCDPGNMFRFNQNILPHAAQEEV